MERPEGEHLLLEVLEDDSVYALPELLPGLAVLRVVREPAARGLELAGVEDELARGSRAAGLWARDRLRVLVSGLALVGRSACLEDLGASPESGNTPEVLLGLTRPPRLIRTVVGGVLPKVGGIRLRSSEIHDIPDFRI